MAASGRRSLWTLISVLIILMLLISYTGEERERTTAIEDVILSVVVPVQNFFTSLGQNIQSFFTAIAYHREIKEENEMLQEEAARAREKAVLLEELRRENERLRAKLDFAKREEMELLSAQVVARDPSRWFDTITLNRGYSDGVEVEMPVVAPGGLVGMTYSVSSHSSKVLLITNPRLKVSAMVQESRDPGTFGIVEGQLEDHPFIKLENLPPDAAVEPGDSIITSGMGGVFPKGLFIGRVEEVREDEFGLVKYAMVISSVNFNRLEEVFVVTSYEDALYHENGEYDEDNENRHDQKEDEKEEEEDPGEEE